MKMEIDTDSVICPICHTEYYGNRCQHLARHIVPLVNEARQWAKYYKARTRYFYGRSLILSHQADEFMSEWDKLCKEEYELRRKLTIAREALERYSRYGDEAAIKALAEMDSENATRPTEDDSQAG